MPTTDDDAALIAAMPPGTRVDHWKHGAGVVADRAVEYGQIPVQFPDRIVFCYPSNLSPEER